jgi:hypothetical protein
VQEGSTIPYRQPVVRRKACELRLCRVDGKVECEYRSRITLLSTQFLTDQLVNWPVFFLVRATTVVDILANRTEPARTRTNSAYIVDEGVHVGVHVGVHDDEGTEGRLMPM